MISRVGLSTIRAGASVSSESVKFVAKDPGPICTRGSGQEVHAGQQPALYRDNERANFVRYIASFANA